MQKKIFQKCCSSRCILIRIFFKVLFQEEENDSKLKYGVRNSKNNVEILHLQVKINKLFHLKNHSKRALYVFNEDLLEALKATYKEIVLRIE